MKIGTIVRLLAIIVLFTTTFSYSQAAPLKEQDPGWITLYKGNDCEGKVVGLLTAVPQGHNFKNDKIGLVNDDARSMKLENISASIVIRLYDSPKAKTNDDWAEMWFNSFTGSICVPTFESGYDEDIGTTTNGHGIFDSANYYWHNGLDGKVSNIQIAWW